ncbi:MAG: hypothetical protein WAM14_05085 [Candidatus Nitrosopolaris sp.]
MIYTSPPEWKRKTKPKKEKPFLKTSGREATTKDSYDYRKKTS